MRLGAVTRKALVARRHERRGGGRNRNSRGNEGGDGRVIGGTSAHGGIPLVSRLMAGCAGTSSALARKIHESLTNLTAQDHTRKATRIAPGGFFQPVVTNSLSRKCYACCKATRTSQSTTQMREVNVTANDLYMPNCILIYLLYHIFFTWQEFSTENLKRPLQSGNDP
jgi:hypothetical protein